jgi:hypothetical protein
VGGLAFGPGGPNPDVPNLEPVAGQLSTSGQPSAAVQPWAAVEPAVAVGEPPAHGRTLASPVGDSVPAAARAPQSTVIQPLGAARYKVQFTASAGLKEKLLRLRALMRSQVPDGDLAAIIEQAVTEKLARLEARRFGRTSRPRKSLGEADTTPTSRRIPAAVRRAVHVRDGGRCRYVDVMGRRCPERDQLEFHHRHPFGMGGDHSPGNIRLTCRVHNALLAEHDYGRKAAARERPD